MSTSSALSNRELADIFDKIADLLEIKGEVIYKTLAYRRAAESLRANPGEQRGSGLPT